jgi:ankyrin repeat protein
MNTQTISAAVCVYMVCLAALPCSMAAPPGDSIHLAVRNDDTAGIRRWLAEDIALLNARDADGLTPLHIAACKYRRRAFDLLLASGADVKAKTAPCRMTLDTASGSFVFAGVRSDWTALHIVAVTNRIDMAEALIARGADVNARNDRGQTPLFLTAEAGHLPMARLLIERGVRVGAKPTAGGRSPLQAAVFGGHVGLAQLLLANGAALDPLSAAGLGRTSELQAALKHKPTLAGPQKVAESAPLYWAAKFGHTATVEMLVAAGAAIGCRDRQGATPMILTAMGGHAKTAELLLAKGAKVDAWDDAGRTALHHAAAAGHTQVVRLLVEHGAKLTAEDRKGRTPLQLAEAQGHRQVVELLRRRTSQPTTASGPAGRTM